MVCANIGYSNFIANDRLLGIVTPDSAPTKRLVQRAKEQDRLIDTTFGRKTRSILIMDNGYLFLSSLQPETVVQRLKAPEDAQPGCLEGTRQIRRNTKFYNLDMILAVGYRVRSNVGMHFRRWASGVLTEHMKKGFVLNDERLCNPREFGADYFDELLERIRDIRASEKRVYQKVKDIFALSVDYDRKSPVIQNFFKSVQNKLEYAATGHTAPEIIAARADASKDNMATWAPMHSKVPRGAAVM